MKSKKKLLLLVIVVSCAVIAMTYTGVTALISHAWGGSTARYGDAVIVTKTTLMGGTLRSLKSPKFSLAAGGDYAFEFRGLPEAEYPQTVIVNSPGYSDERPGYLSSVFEVSFEDLDSGVAYFKKTVSLASLTQSGGGYWPTSKKTFEEDELPEPRTNYRVRISIVSGSDKPIGKAYLYRFLGTGSEERAPGSR